MTKRVQQMIAGGGAVAAAVVGAAGMAFACTASADLRIGKVTAPPGTPAEQSEQALTAGSTVGLVGEWFREGTPVEIHWDSPTGPQLATVSGPAFAARVTVPSADPGVHTIVAIQGGSAAAGDGAGPVVQRAVAVAVHSPGSAPAESRARLYAAAQAPGLAEGPTSTFWAAALVGAGMVALGAGAVLAVVRRRPSAVTRRIG